MAFAG
jgi:hypothetical protein